MLLLTFVRIYRLEITLSLSENLCCYSKWKQQSFQCWLTTLSVHGIWKMAYFQISQTGLQCCHMSHWITLASLCYVTSRMWLTLTTCKTAEQCCPPGKFQYGTVFRNQDFRNFWSLRKWGRSLNYFKGDFYFFLFSISLSKDLAVEGNLQLPF